MNNPLSMNKKNIVLNQIASFGDQKYPSFELRIIFEYLAGRGYVDWCQKQMSELGLEQSDLDLPFINSHQALGGLNRVINEFYTSLSAIFFSLLMYHKLR